MTEQDLDQIRTVMREALAPIDVRLASLEVIEARLSSLEAKVDSWPDLHFLQDSIQRQQRDILSFRDDMRVSTAIAMRLDTSHSTLLDELRAMHTQIFPMNDRLHKLEDHCTTPPL
jgi:hypothetical protein